MAELRFAGVAAASWQALTSSLHPALAIVVLIFAPLGLTYIFTWIKSVVFHRTKEVAEEPHTVPYVLPWLGNFPSFMFNSRRYQLALQ